MKAKGEDYKTGVKEGRRQIIANLKKHYDEDYCNPPKDFSGSSVGVSMPENTLYRYFKEIQNKGIIRG